MELWIVISIIAAFLQNVRSALQKYLKGQLSDFGATFVRFGYGFPLAIAYVGILNVYFLKPIPEFNTSFFMYAISGGLSQIIATFLLISLFSHRNFAASTAFSKTEPVQAAILGLIILGDSVSLFGVFAILIAVLGVVAITLARNITRNGILSIEFTGRSALLGLLSGAFFGISGVSYRGASLSLTGSDFVMHAACTLALVTIFQTSIMLIYMLLFDRAQILRVVKAWRSASVVGIAGVAGSACWFTAMAIQNAAYVKAVGQIELVFTLFVSWFLFKEKVYLLELVGIAMILIGIFILILG